MLPSKKITKKLMFWLLMLAMLALCIPFGRRIGDGANLVRQDQGKIKLQFWTHSWQSPLSANGPQSVRRIEPYSAALLGDGPIFTNPPFKDYYGMHYFGTITLNKKMDAVLVDMHGDISTNENIVLIKDFSGNGSYAIQSIKTAEPFERSMFDFWITNGIGDPLSSLKEK